MKLSSFMTRAVAAGAVVGLALIGPAVAAGAASLPVSLPVTVGQVVTGPVVNVVPSPASPAGSGADATVPAHGDASASVPATDSGQPAKSRASVDACVATALLTGHDVAGCGANAGNSGSASAPSLADLLSRVGACARLALERGQSTNVCASSDSGAAGGADLGSVAGSAPGSASDLTPFSSDAVGKVVADSGLCDSVDQLGLGFDACSITGAATGGRSRGSGSATGNVTADQATADVCRGFAVVAGLDPANCTVKADAKTGAKTAASASASPSKAGVRAASRTQAGSGTLAPTQLNANCASSNASVATPSPFGNPATAGLGTMGALGGLVMALRRVRRPRLG